MRVCITHVSLFFPPCIPNHSGVSLSQLHSFIHQTLSPRLSVFCLCISDPISPPSVSHSLYLSGIRALKLLSLWPLTSQVTSSPSLTFRVGAALGKRRRADLPIRGTVELQGGQQGLALLHDPTSWAGFWVSGDLVIGCSGSEVQCQRTCGRHVEIREVCCNGVMSLYAAPSC